MLVCTLGDLLLDVIVRLEQPLARSADADSVVHLGPGGQAALSGPGAEGAMLALPGSSGSKEARQLGSDSSHENIEEVKLFVAQDPRVAAQVIKGWVGD